MTIAFIVNDIKTEIHTYVTMQLAFKCMKAGHTAFVGGVGDFVYLPDGHMAIDGYRVQEGTESAEVMLRDMQASAGKILIDEGKQLQPVEQVTSRDLDIMFIRNDPSNDQANRAWAQSAGVVFGKIAVQNGVIVLNDPDSLHNALNKMYFQHFPEIIRPKTIITRHVDEIRAFYEDCDCKIVLKPLQGSGGKDVFMVKDEKSNLASIVDAIARNGYIIAQEFLPEASGGDTRMFVVNGKPLMHDGKYAAFKRVNDTDDFRSNMHAGGHAESVEVTEEMLKLAEAIRPKLLRDGLFMVGLDIVGSKLMEINIFSPGGLISAERAAGTEFYPSVIEAFEKKVRYREMYNYTLTNKELSVID